MIYESSYAELTEYMQYKILLYYEGTVDDNTIWNHCGYRSETFNVCGSEMINRLGQEKLCVSAMSTDPIYYPDTQAFIEASDKKNHTITNLRNYQSVLSISMFDLIK